MRPGWWSAVVAVVVIAGCSGGSGSDSQAEEVRSLGRPDAEVFMNVVASPAEIAAVHAAIRRSPLVRSFAFLSKRDAYREFRRLFRRQPELAATTSPDALPASFRVTLVHIGTRDRFARALEPLNGVDQVKTQAASSSCAALLDRQQRAGDLTPLDEIEVSMARSSTEAEIANVRAAVERSPLVRSFRFLSQDDAYREFQRLFADEPDLLATTTPDQLPMSFKVKLNDAEKRAQLARTLHPLAGVDEIKYQPTDRQTEQLVRRLAELGAETAPFC
jgi:cell division protein FtsX